MGSTASPAGPAITQVVDASAALATLQQIERNAQTIGNDAAGLLGGLQSALQSVRRGPLHPGEPGLIGHESLLYSCSPCACLLARPRHRSHLSWHKSQTSQLSHNSVDYMTVYRDSAANMSTAVGSSVEQGRSFIDECVKLDERMADLNALAVQVRGVNEALTGLEAALGLSDDGAPKAAST